jgi:hypothetical protein
MATASYNSPTATDRWHRFSAATVRAFHRYGTWLVSLSWWRFGWYSLLLLIGTGIIQKLPPFSWTYTETVVDTSHRRAAHSHDHPAVAPVAPVITVPVQPPASAASVASLPPVPPFIHITKAPASASGTESKTVDINLPGIVVDTKDHSVRNRGVNISFANNGIHISTDDDPTDKTARADEAAASAAADVAATAAAAASAARSSAHSARASAQATRDAALANAEALRASAAEIRAGAIAAAHATAEQAARQAASAPADSASESAVDIVVAGQHVRIGVPAHATSEEVRDAVNTAKESIVESLKDAEAAQRDAAREAADAAKEAADAHSGDDEDDDTEVDSDGNRSTVRTHTMHYGEMLPLMAIWWVLGSMLLKITYKGRIQAEVKAAVATETAEAE